MGGAARRRTTSTAEALPSAGREDGLWVFLGVATSLFVLFISAYAMRLGLADWTPLPRAALLLMLNTACWSAPAWRCSGRCMPAPGDRRQGAARPDGWRG